MVGKLDGVAGQVGNDLAKSERVPDQVVGNIRGNIEQYLNAFFNRLDPQGSYGLTEGGAQFERNGFEIHAPCFNLGKVEDIVDDGQQVVGRDGDVLQVFTLLRGEVCGGQQFAHADDAVHGGADFVAHGGQKLTLGPIGVIGSLAGGQQLFLHPFAVMDVGE